MTETARARYTLEFKQEAVRLVEGVSPIASVKPATGPKRRFTPAGIPAPGSTPFHILKRTRRTLDLRYARASWICAI